MSIFTSICLILCGTTIVSLVDAVQYKMRGPPSTLAQRQYLKPKWGLAMPGLQRAPMRTHRPNSIPVRMPSYKAPLITRPPKPYSQMQPKPMVQQAFKGQPNLYSQPQPLIFPSSIWKTPTAVYRPPVVAPPVVSPYEPYSLNTVKQIGEKGPIHTIPAPNLSPADKPNVFVEQPVQKQTIYQYTKEPDLIQNSVVPTNGLLGVHALPLVQQIPQRHQYQVTENADVHDELIPNPFLMQKPYYAPDPDQSNLIPKLTQYPESNLIQKLNQYSDSNLIQKLTHTQYPESNLIPKLTQYSETNTLGGQLSNQGSQLSAQDLYQLLNGLPQQPIQVPDVASQVATNFKPQFHTFNYEEQGSDHSKLFAQSRVTSDYRVDSDLSEENLSPNEALAQTQYIQQYFTTQDNNLKSDDTSNLISKLSSKHELSPSMFYSSLPNKEAAETLANLQAAGNVNSNILKLKTTQNDSTKLRIYVPDEEDTLDDLEPQASGEKGQTFQGDLTGTSLQQAESQSLQNNEKTHLQPDISLENTQNLEYEDYLSNEDDNHNQYSDSKESNNTQNQVIFGSKLNIKGNTTR